VNTDDRHRRGRAVRVSWKRGEPPMNAGGPPDRKKVKKKHILLSFGGKRVQENKKATSRPCNKNKGEKKKRGTSTSDTAFNSLRKRGEKGLRLPAMRGLN